MIIFNIIAVSKLRLLKSKLPPNDISLPNYSHVLYPMKPNSGSTLIYTSNHFPYKPKNNLIIYERCCYWMHQ